MIIFAKYSLSVTSKLIPQYHHYMFFILSKILYYLVLPFSWIVITALTALFHKNNKVKKNAFRTSIALLLIFSNEFLINEVMVWWEIPVRPLNEITTPYDIGIILSGVTIPDKMPDDRIYFKKGADRVMHPVQLYKMGMVRKILVSGGNGQLVDKGWREADQIKNILLYSGIPEEDIIIENNSDNTFQNAVYSCEILKRDFPNQKYLLVTSAFHMRRSEACFKKQGIDFDVFSTDFYTHERRFSPDVFIPDAYALLKWEIFIKEITGIMMYKLVGYI